MEQGVGATSGVDLAAPAAARVETPGAARCRWRSRWGAPLLVFLLGLVWYGWAMLEGAVVADRDLGRDLMAALDAARGLPWHDGPAVRPFELHLGFHWFLWLSLPLRFAPSLEAVLVWSVLWQAATAAALFGWLRPFAGGVGALVGLVAFVGATATQNVYGVLSHANLAPLLVVGVLACAGAWLQRGARGAFVGVWFLLALAINTHLTLALLAPALLWLAWHRGPSLGVAAALGGWGAVVVGLLPGLAGQRMQTLLAAAGRGDLWPLLSGNVALLVVLCVLLVCAEPRRFGRGLRLSLLTAACLVAVVFAQGAPEPTFGAFNFELMELRRATGEETPFRWAWALEGFAGLIVPAGAPWPAALCLGALVLAGALALIRRRGGGALAHLGPALLAIFVCTLPLGLYATGRSGGGTSRYLVPALVSCAALAALGWRLLEPRLSWWRWPAVLGLVALTALGHPGRRPQVGVASTARTAAALAEALPLDRATVGRRLHGHLGDSAVGDGQGSVHPFLLATWPARETTDSGSHVRLLRDAPGCRRVAGALCAVIYEPRLVAAVQGVPPGLSPEGGLWPLRTMFLAAGQRVPVELGVSGAPVDAQAGSGVELLLRREAGAAVLDEVVILVASEDGRGCEVSLSPGFPSPVSGPPGLFRFRVPEAPAGGQALRLRIDGCSLTYLDAFDGASSDQW